MAVSQDSNMVARIVSSLIDIKHTLRLVYQRAVDSVNPLNLIKKELKCSDGVLTVADKTFTLNNNVYLVGFGKAVLGMAYQTELQMGNHLKTGILSIPIGQRDKYSEFSFKADSVIKIIEGAENNIPDFKALNSSKQIVNLVKKLTEKDVLLVLISGGGSALLPLPIPPITLEDKITVITLLQRAGADISELNTVRKRLSMLKGGGLLSLAYPAEVIAFILSDVVGDPLDLIASAPTVINKDDPEKAKMIFKKYSLLDKIPISIKQIVEQPLQMNYKEASVLNILIGTNKIALEAALNETKKKGYEGIILTDVLEGLVSDIFLCYIRFVECICGAISDNLPRDEFIKHLQPCLHQSKISEAVFMKLVDMIYLIKPVRLCLLFGGEPTVRITGDGKGGRSLQLCLQFSNALNKSYIEYGFMNKFNVALLCGGTDGIDGPTDAAGAIAYNGQIEIAHNQNLDPITYIENCDSYSFFSELNNGEDLLKIGHTGTNVMDIHILLIELNQQ